MKTFKEWCEDAEYAQMSLAFEAKGFKGDIGKQKAENKARKRDKQTAKELRRKKVMDLLQRDASWKNLR